MRHIVPFILAVGSEWVALMSGIASVAIAVWLQINKKSVIGSGVSWATGILCLFLAFFLAWRKEHVALVQQQAEVERLSKPIFVVELLQSISGYDALRDATLVFMTVKVTNRGSDSSIVEWHVHYKSKTLDQDVRWFY